ncbi:MAG: pyridoxamine 5'-phosphate oxidase family protein [Promethearchaeota archaeon]
MKINYDELKKEIEDFFRKNKSFVLATSANDKVSARTMDCINIGLKIMFETDRRSGKFKQMEKNPNVALCTKNVQIEGVAKIRKHPLDESNKKFIELYKKNHLYAYQLYSHLKNSVVIRVEPKLITLWKHINGKPLRDFLFIDKRIARREYYDISK